jgi:hypothetical protein
LSLCSITKDTCLKPGTGSVPEHVPKNVIFIAESSIVFLPEFENTLIKLSFQTFLFCSSGTINLNLGCEGLFLPD